VGWHPVQMSYPGSNDAVLAGIPWESMQFHLHGRSVTRLPEAGITLASSQACKNQAFCVGMRTYGFQYHFEWTRQDIDAILRENAEWVKAVNGAATDEAT